MRRTVRALSALACVAVAALAAVPTEAHGGRRAGFGSPPSSVFPQPRDPWRSWGVHRERPHHVGRPPARVHDRRFHDGRFVDTPARGTVWVPGHWVWDGATWVWWPGHWGVR